MALKRLSASQVDTFDSTTPFGCERKWYYQHVMKLEVPQDPSAALGEAVHKSIEDYLLGAHSGADGLHPVALAGRANIDELHPRVQAVEVKFENVFVGAVPFTGRIDIVEGGEPPGITDWKTTSDIKRYGKTADALKTNTQMLVYAYWYYLSYKPLYRGPIRLTHVYFQTRGKKSEVVTTTLEHGEVLRNMQRVHDLVGKMWKASEKSSAQELTACWEKCNIARGCPFRAMCVDKPLNQGDEAMGLFDMFGEDAGAPAETKPVTEAPKPAEPKKHKLEIQDVVDEEPAAEDPIAKAEKALAEAKAKAEAAAKEKAAKEQAEKAAKAKEYMGAENHAQAVAAAGASAEKRGPGRPPGSKNKQKDEPIGNGIEVKALPDVSAKPAPTAVKLTRIMVRHGVTLNLGNYQSARVEVELEATGDITDATRADLGAKAKRALEEECKPYLPKPKAPPPERAADE